jgi:uncharacterized Tic20 family protein
MNLQKKRIIELEPLNGEKEYRYGPADSRENTWAMLCHLSASLGYFLPFGHILGPLMIWLLKGQEFPKVNEHGREALNFQISVTLYALLAGILVVIGIGIPLLVFLFVFDLIAIIVAAVKTRGGEPVRYPLCIRFLK